jgi:hypothetical protein
MRKFWGRNEQSNSSKFSRDNDQIIALNYENLCDSDYLTRLFVLDNSSQGKEDVVEGRMNDSSSLHPEISEDVIVFGKNLPLGKYFFKKRLHREIASSIKANDPLSHQISRQVVVFDHMASLLSEKCKQEYSYQSTKSENEKDKSKVPKIVSPMTALAIKYCFGFVGEDKSLSGPTVSFQKIQSVLVSLTHFFRLDPASDLLALPQFGEMRKLFQNVFNRLLSSEFLSQADWSRKEFEDDIKLALSGIYGFLIIGILTNNISDVFSSLHYLMYLMMVVEDKVDLYLTRIKELLTITNSASNMQTISSGKEAGQSNVGASTKSIPNKVQGKMLNKPPNPQQKNASPQKEFQTDESNEAKIELREYSNNNNNNNNNGDSPSNNNQEGPALKSHGSAQKLWDKASNTKLDSSSKGKLVMKGKGGNTNEPKMLYEYLDSNTKEQIPSSVIISNHVLVNYSAPGSATNNTATSSSSAKRINNNNDSSPAPKASYQQQQQSQTRDQSELTPRTTLKRIEKDIKSAHNSIFSVPQLVLNLFGEYCNTIANTASPTKAASNLIKSGLKNGARPYSNRVYSCGQNSYGELGLGDTNLRKSFSKIALLDDKKIISIGAGNEHSLFVSTDGKLLTVGYNDNGQCGIGSSQQVRQPSVVQALEDEEIQQVHVYNGCEHTLVLTKDGKLFSFGYNYRGQVNKNFFF